GGGERAGGRGHGWILPSWRRAGVVGATARVAKGGRRQTARSPQNGTLAHGAAAAGWPGPLVDSARPASYRRCEVLRGGRHSMSDRSIGPALMAALATAALAGCASTSEG